MAELQDNKPLPETPENNLVDTPVAIQPKERKELSIFRKLSILLAIISFLVYANTLYNDYVLDDNMMISDNQYVKEGLKGIPKLLTTPHLKGYAPNLTDTYRPLSLVMFAMENQFFGNVPAVGHLFSVLVFAGTVLMLFFFLHKLLGEEKITLAFITALLFAVHPIHAETVANIKSRDELLCFFFTFFSLNIFIDYARKGELRNLLLGTLSLFLAIISKETAATFIILIPLIFFFYENENRKRSILISCSAFTVTAVFIIIRTILINKYRADGMIIFTLLDNQLVIAPDTTSRIATAILILGNYLKLVFIPYPLVCDYSYHTIPFVGFGNPWVLLSLTVYLGLTCLAIYRLFKNKKDLWALGILFYLVTLSMFSNIAFIVGATQADRFAFFASAGTCLILALAIEKWLLRSDSINALKSWKGGVLFAICLVYASITIARNTDWKDNYTLFRADVEKLPNNTRLFTFLGTELEKKYEAATDPEEKAKIKNDCIKYLKKAIAIYPNNASAHAELGTTYILDNEYDSAVVHFKRAIELDPTRLNAVTNLGALYSMQGKFIEASPYFQRSTALDPTDVQSWFNLAICYLQLGKYDSAIVVFNKTIALDPEFNYHLAYANKAVAFKLLGKLDSASVYEAIAKQYDPRFNLEEVKIK